MSMLIDPSLNLNWSLINKTGIAFSTNKSIQNIGCHKCGCVNLKLKNIRNFEQLKYLAIKHLHFGKCFLGTAGNIP